MTDHENLKDDLNAFQYICFMITTGIIFVILKVVDFIGVIRGLK